MDLIIRERFYYALAALHPLAQSGPKQLQQCWRSKKKTPPAMRDLRFGEAVSLFADPLPCALSGFLLSLRVVSCIFPGWFLTSLTLV